MDKYVVACVQQRMRLPQSTETLADDLRRFLRSAQAKQARLVVFPERGGDMAALPLLRDRRSLLLKRADLGRRRTASWSQKVGGALAGYAASVLKADMRTAHAALLSTAPDDVWRAYATLFGGLAREFGVTLVAPSAYLPDPDDGLVRNLAAVFGSDGALLGVQSKMMLHPEDEGLAQPSGGFDVIDTEVGRLGLILGSDMLYPEVGRLLAYQGAEVLVGQGACPDPALYNKLRAGMLARMQENQLFSAVSFLVGENALSRDSQSAFTGKSAVFAPQELTPRFSGVLVEMGGGRSEGVVTAEWNFPALRALWESSDTPVRRSLSLPQANQAVAKLYAQLRALPDYGHVAARAAAPTQPALEAGTDADCLVLEDLPVLASITSRWPLPSHAPLPDVIQDDWTEAPRPAAEAAVPAAPDETAVASVKAEDETDEMDALPSASDKSA